MEIQEVPWRDPQSSCVSPPWAGLSLSSLTVPQPMEQLSHPRMERNGHVRDGLWLQGREEERSSPCQALREQMEDELGHAESPRPFLTLQMAPAAEEPSARAWRALDAEEKL